MQVSADARIHTREGDRPGRFALATAFVANHSSRAGPADASCVAKALVCGGRTRAIVPGTALRQPEDERGWLEPRRWYSGTLDAAGLR